MTADPLPLTEVLDQLERLADGVRAGEWEAEAYGGIFVGDDQLMPRPEYGDLPWDSHRDAAIAAIHLLRPMVEALRAAAEVDGREMYEHADQGDGFCDACEIPFPCSYADLRARLAALRDAAALELEEKNRG